MGRYYLKRIHMQAFGRFVDKTVGPFSPGLTVVHGANEAGKTTASAFVRGVLFGWEDARGSRNVYKPASAGRAGSLIFCDRETGETAELSRARNADGLRAAPAEAAQLAGDADKATYASVFALTSDELRGLGDAGDMASRLLTAGSGTKVGPAAALAAIDARIAALMSRAAAAEQSFPNIKRALDECNRRFAAARAESDALKSADAERRELADRRADAAREMSEQGAREMGFAACKADLERLAVQAADARERLARARELARACEVDVRSASRGGVLDISAEDEAALRDAVEREMQARSRIEHRLEAAQDDFEQARARFESAPRPSGAAGAGPLAVLIAAAGVLALLAIAAAIFALSGAVGGGASIVFAIAATLALMAAFGLVCAALLRRRRAPSGDEREAARRAMLERKSVLEAREEEALVAEARVEGMLSAAGLAQARGSLRRACELLDASRDARASRERAAERLAGAQERVALAEQALAAAARERASSLAACGFGEDATAADVEAALAAASAARVEATEQARRLDRRIGELSQMLAAGERAAELDMLKTERAQLATRQQESGVAFARLLLARRMVADAMRAWESESQPEVYARASALMALMTDGAWEGVRMGHSGAVEAIDAVGRAWEPRLLSLGTCQQLYLALRIALLECVEHVGASLPVLADDILVNFDDSRRKGSVAALAQLARKRQVIVFTCHKEIVRLIRRCESECRVLEL